MHDQLQDVLDTQPLHYRIRVLHVLDTRWRMVSVQGCPTSPLGLWKWTGTKWQHQTIVLGGISKSWVYSIHVFGKNFKASRNPKGSWPWLFFNDTQYSCHFKASCMWLYTWASWHYTQSSADWLGWTLFGLSLSWRPSPLSLSWHKPTKDRQLVVFVLACSVWFALRWKCFFQNIKQITPVSNVLKLWLMCDSLQTVLCSPCVIPARRPQSQRQPLLSLSRNRPKHSSHIQFMSNHLNLQLRWVKTKQT